MQSQKANDLKIALLRSAVDGIDIDSLIPRYGVGAFVELFDKLAFDILVGLAHTSVTVRWGKHVDGNWLKIGFVMPAFVDHTKLTLKAMGIVEAEFQEPAFPNQYIPNWDEALINACLATLWSNRIGSFSITIDPNGATVDYCAVSSNHHATNFLISDGEGHHSKRVRFVSDEPPF